ncbi:ABC transporter permease [Pseudonocardia acidicola]|uniref:ABC transporter permease n=1 Tax=Pseudonocardia acidicola TaxID=2724939 RepID=A0ABX1S6Y8_9PSEU|nr:ABC transporter permease [Pseudonocardia acidicola]NMH97325.1 ABC transporter permease [Pseudonocardia acidicola]
MDSGDPTAGSVAEHQRTNHHGPESATRPVPVSPSAFGSRQLPERTGIAALLGGSNRPSRLGQISLRRGLVSVVVVFALWEAAVRVFRPSTVIIVAPSAIAQSFWQLTLSGELLRHFWVSMYQFMLGYLVAVAIAIPLGLFMGASRRAHDYGDPWLTALYATPSVALAPLFVVWLGFGDAAHVSIIALVAFFPVIINTIDGVHAVERDLREVGIAFRANRREVFGRIDLPGSLPYIFTGLRLALARALVGIVVADLFGAQAGLGYLILTSSQLFQTGAVFVGVFVLAALGVVLTWALRALQRKLTPWQLDVKGKL